MKSHIKVLIAKPGLDGHEAGALLVTKALIDAKIEVVYLGIRQTPEMIVEAAIQEDVDIIGLSVLSGIHIESSKEILKLLKNKNAESIHLIVGGIIPFKDKIQLLNFGVKEVFTPGTKIKEIIEKVKKIAANEKPGVYH